MYVSLLTRNRCSRCEKTAGALSLLIHQPFEATEDILRFFQPSAGAVRHISGSVIDITFVVLTAIFNKQFPQYDSGAALAVFGAAINFFSDVGA